MAKPAHAPTPGRVLSTANVICRILAPFPQDGAAGEQHWATYTQAGTAVPFVISELPGERAEALFIAMAALVPTAGEQFPITPGLRLRVARQREIRRLNRKLPACALCCRRPPIYGQARQA